MNNATNQKHGRPMVASGTFPERFSQVDTQSPTESSRRLSITGWELWQEDTEAA